MEKIKIFIDTAADMPEAVAAEKNFGVLRFMSVFGDESFVTGTELTNEAFYKKLAESEVMPKTAQTPYQDMYDALFEAARAHETVIYFAISSKASGQFNTARMIAEEIKEEYPEADLRIVDTESFSAYISLIAYKAAELLAEGKSADEIIEESLKVRDGWEAYMLVDSLTYLEKGGRINKASAIVGTLLDIKPVLSIRNGLIEAIEKLRGKKKLCKKLVTLAMEDPRFDGENPEMIIVHSNKEAADELAEVIEEEIGKQPSMVFEFGPIIGTHAGPGTVAILAKIK